MKNLFKNVPLLLAMLLLVIWLTLAGELSAAQIVLGAVLSVGLVIVISQLRPVRPRVRRLYLAIPLAATVCVDILRSNLSVAAIILGLAGDRQIRSGFLDIPLQLRDPHALTMLAIIVTATPGTSWAGISRDGSSLRVHVLDLIDEQTLIHIIKQRYEAPLRRMFE